jgi:hypothetical protein
MFVETNIGVWADLLRLFKRTKEKYGRIDHVFLNAGIGPSADYFSDEVDENGDLIEPSSRTFDITLKGTINTATIAIHYLKQQPEGGSLVINASTSAIQRQRAVDYCKYTGDVPLLLGLTRFSLVETRRPWLWTGHQCSLQGSQDPYPSQSACAFLDRDKYPSTNCGNLQQPRHCRAACRCCSSLRSLFYGQPLNGRKVCSDTA